MKERRKMRQRRSIFSVFRGEKQFFAFILLRHLAIALMMLFKEKTWFERKPVIPAAALKLMSLLLVISLLPMVLGASPGHVASSVSAGNFAFQNNLTVDLWTDREVG